MDMKNVLIKIKELRGDDESKISVVVCDALFSFEFNYFGN
jgi:hypothetical protein